MPRTTEHRLELPNGLAAYGATPATVRLYQLIRDYFDLGLGLERGMTVFDVGANIGLFSLEVLQRCAGDVRLFAFEPAPAVFADLERNVTALYPAAPVRLYRCAVGDRRRNAVFYYRPLAPMLSSLEPDGPIDEHALAGAMVRDGAPAGYRGIHGPLMRRLPRRMSGALLAAMLRLSQRRTEEVSCEVLTVSDVLREHAVDRLDLLKIDVEGAELDVLHGVDADDWSKVGAVVAEVHDVDGRVQVVRELLEEHGLTRVEVHQDWLFEPTDIHMVFGRRR